MIDHLINNNSIKDSCLYCLNSGNNLNWKSDFEREVHYKSCKCDCGKELRLRMPFYGSGEDSFDDKNKSIEDKI